MWLTRDSGPTNNDKRNSFLFWEGIEGSRVIVTWRHRLPRGWNQVRLGVDVEVFTEHSCILVTRYVMSREVCRVTKKSDYKGSGKKRSRPFTSMTTDPNLSIHLNILNFLILLKFLIINILLYYVGSFTWSFTKK